MTARPLVIYHAGCIDGWTAAWAADRALGGAELLAASYGDPPPDVEGRRVYIVDFSYRRAVLEEMYDRADYLRVIDHHATAAAELEGLSYATFDMGRSGAGLTWDVLCPRTTRPWLVDYVEDRDLWRFELAASREVNAALGSYAFSLETWDKLAASSLGTIGAQGRAIVRYQAQLIDRHVASARRAFIVGPESGPHHVPIVNATALVSEVGNELALGAPFAALWRERPDGGFSYSLRSSAANPDHLDVGKLAAEWGGGGHRHAAGFETPVIVHFDVDELGEGLHS